MGKFYGAIGFGMAVETSPGVFVNQIIERKYSGDVARLASRWERNENLNNDVVMNNMISIISDPFARENYYAIKYAVINHVKWKVQSIEVNYPRITILIGGVYNGE